MLKRLLVGGGIAGVLTVGIIIGSLTLGPVFAQTGNNDTGQGQATVQSVVDDDAAEAAVEGPDTDNIELEEQVGDQSEIDDSADEAAGEEEDIEGVEPADEQAQEESLTGGGHQDSEGENIDHQFDGIE
jgi:hypothetical protein